MKATRLIVLIALTGLAVLYWVSFVLFAEPKDNEVPKHASNSQKINWGAIPTEGIDVVWLWTDPHNKMYYSIHDDWLRKESSNIKSGHYIPEVSTSRAFNHLKYMLRAVFSNIPWIRRAVIIMPDECNLPPSFNASHPSISVVKYSEFIPADLLPTFNWRAVLFHIHKIPHITRLFLYLNHFDIVAREIAPGVFLSPLGEKSIFMEDLRAVSHASEEMDILTKTQNYVLPEEKDYLGVETRGPILLDKDILAEIEETYVDIIDETKKHRFRARTSLDPLLMHQLHVIKRGRKLIAATDVGDIIRQFDSQDDGLLDEDEFSQLAAYTRLDTASFKNLLNINSDKDITVEMVLKSQEAKNKVAMATIPEKYRYALVPSISEIIDSQDNIFEFIDTKLSRWKILTGTHPVLHFGRMVITNRIANVRTRVEYFFGQVFGRPSPLEDSAHYYYSLSLFLALLFIASFCCGTYTLTKFLTSTDR